jgi:hypothetical protein
MQYYSKMSPCIAINICFSLHAFRFHLENLIVTTVMVVFVVVNHEFELTRELKCERIENLFIDFSKAVLKNIYPTQA